jgi:hypothetical protein
MINVILHLSVPSHKIQFLISVIESHLIAIQNIDKEPSANIKKLGCTRFDPNS